MKGLKKGPELKMPQLKAPTFLADLYYDLRDRRLLPLVGLVLVAIVATPFLLGQGGDVEEEAIPVPPAIQALKESGDQRTSSLTVVEANPGLRDYRKRLRHRTPLDPFRSFGKPSLNGAQLGEGGGAGSSSVGTKADFTSTSTTVQKTKNRTTKTETTTTTTTNGSGKGTGDDNGSGGAAKGGGKAPIYTIDVEISVASNGGISVQPLEKRNVQPLTPLPGQETPVVTYLGAGSGGSKALFSVSKEVTGVYGEANCVSGTATCEVVELEPDFPVTFVYGPNQDRYKIKLLKISRVDGTHS